MYPAEYPLERVISREDLYKTRKRLHKIAFPMKESYSFIKKEKVEMMDYNKIFRVLRYNIKFGTDIYHGHYSVVERVITLPSEHAVRRFFSALGNDHATEEQINAHYERILLKCVFRILFCKDKKRQVIINLPSGIDSAKYINACFAGDFAYLETEEVFNRKILPIEDYILRY